MQTDIRSLDSRTHVLAAIPMALAATVAILALMASLVHSTFEALEDPPAPPFDTPIYTETEIETFPSIKPVAKPIVENPPETPEVAPRDGDDNAVTIAKFIPETGADEGVGLSFTGMPIAQYQVTAKYPRRALQNNIEGYVDVRFDITAIGTTKNIVVVQSSPEGIFDTAAVDAVKRWRYRPRMEEGKAMPFPGMVQRISFVLSQDS